MAYNFFQLLHPSMVMQQSEFIGEVAYPKGSTYIYERKVRIPQIQRDYAQGRQNDDVRGKRTSFLKGLIDTLYSSSSPLFPVDFIYGYIRLSNGNMFTTGSLTLKDIQNTDLAFEPLDGQQRLTTLFVLHWLFGREKELLDSRTGLSLFTYQTRTSSEQFCDELIKHDATMIVQQWQAEYAIAVSLNKMIKTKWVNNSGSTDYQLKLKNPLVPMPSFSSFFRNLDWFNWNWNNDATVISMLNVMETTLELLSEFGYKYSDGIANASNLDNVVFDLLDDLDCNGERLFVKMNARGKFLSSFDLLKSKLEEELELQSAPSNVHEDWSTRIDGNWIDYCWDKNSAISGKKRAEAAETLLECMLKRLICHSFIGKRNQMHNDKVTVDINSKDFGQDLINMVYSHGKEDDDVVGKYADYAYLQRKIQSCSTSCLYKLQTIDFDKIRQDIDNLIYWDGTNWKDVSDILLSMGFIYFPLQTNMPLLKHYFSSDKSMGYQECIMLHALILFCRKNNASVIASNTQQQTDLLDWMNFVQHVSLNSNRNARFDTPQKFDDGIKLIDSWFGVWDPIISKVSFIDYLANHISIGSNEPDRETEEKLKSQLRLGLSSAQNPSSASKWNTYLTKYESNSFLSGQLIAPLEWSKVNGIYDESRFDTYASKLTDLLKQAESDVQIDALAIQAMLCIMDYRKLNTHDFGSLLSFNKNAKAGLGWKQYLRSQSRTGVYGEVVNILIDQWVASKNSVLEDFLRNYVSTTSPSVTDWRQYILGLPVPGGFDKVLETVKQNDNTRNVETSNGVPYMVLASTVGGQKKFDVLLAMWAYNKHCRTAAVASVSLLRFATSITSIKFVLNNGDEIVVESMHNGNYRLTEPNGTTSVYQQPLLETKLRALNCIV